MSATGADRQQLVEPPLPDGWFVYAQDPAWQPCTAATEHCGRPEGTGSFPTDPDPGPDPEPSPSPDPEPSPSPDPEPSPSPDPEPSPGPDPEPEPGPVADACPPGGVPPGGFTDTAGNIHAAAIDCIVWYGITQGIGQGRYDPAGTVRRDQMASFLARALEAAGVTLPVPNDQGFADIAGNVHAGAINQLAALGVAQGTSGTTFSPRAPVRRDQLATFVDRAHEQVTGLRLPAGAPRFVDTIGNLHAASIDALAAAEIVRGVAPDRYAPAQSVRRDQMASFLARHLGVLAGDGYVTPPI